MSRFSILGISGSLRKESFNTKLVHAAAKLFEPAEFAMGNIRLPLYDQDLEEQGIPDEVMDLAQAILKADGVIISTPEYNKNLSGVLKNALDWLSRTKLDQWKNKPVAILSASAGRSGGERSQYSLRHCMTPFQPRILQGPEFMMAAPMALFNEQGEITDSVTRDHLKALMEALRAEIELGQK